MGRRDAESTGHIEHKKDQEQKRDLTTAKAWEAVRRALGRLISHVIVHNCGPSARTIDVCVVTSNAVAPQKIPLGRADWQPTATVHLAAVPSAGAGLRERAFLPTADLADGDYALAPSAVREMPVVQAEAGHVESLGLTWPCETHHLLADYWHLAAAPIRSGDVLLPVPSGAKSLAKWSVKEPAVRAMRLPHLTHPRVRLAGDALISRMALTRRAEAAGSDREYITAQRRLAEAAYLPVEDIALLGIYPSIPILAVSSIVVEGEGRLLRLWLKPEVLRSRAVPHLITLLVGRQTSTGKMLQTAL